MVPDHAAGGNLQAAAPLPQNQGRIGQRLGDRKQVDPVAVLAALAAKEQHAAGHRVVALELCEAAQVGAPDGAGAFDLDGEQAVAAVGDEVDLRPRP